MIIKGQLLEFHGDHFTQVQFTSILLHPFLSFFFELSTSPTRTPWINQQINCFKKFAGLRVLLLLHEYYRKLSLSLSTGDLSLVYIN